MTLLRLTLSIMVGLHLGELLVKLLLLSSGTGLQLLGEGLHAGSLRCLKQLQDCACIDDVGSRPGWQSIILLSMDVGWRFLGRRWRVLARSFRYWRVLARSFCRFGRSGVGLSWCWRRLGRVAVGV